MMNSILIDSATGDISIAHNQIAIGINSLSELEQIMVANRGEYKEHPFVGGELRSMLHSNGSRFWSNRFKTMCESVGIHIHRAELKTNGIVTISI